MESLEAVIRDKPSGSRANALLGYPGDARLLIVNADDFGMSHAINAAVIQTVISGIATSTSLMAPCPWAAHAMQLLRDLSRIPFGVHLTLIAEHQAYRWGPISPSDHVPTLVGTAGHFHLINERDLMLAGASIFEVEAEFRAQIEKILGAGLNPTHLDWHCLPSGGRPDIFETTLSLAHEYGLAVRIHDADRADHCLANNLPVNEHRLLDSYRLPVDLKPARYADLIRELPVGLSEWAVHASLGDAEAQAMEPASWQVRRTDYEVLIAAETRAVIESEGVILLSYREIQSAWNDAVVG